MREEGKVRDVTIGWVVGHAHTRTHSLYMVIRAQCRTCLLTFSAPLQAIRGLGVGERGERRQSPLSAASWPRIAGFLAPIENSY